MQDGKDGAYRGIAYGGDKFRRGRDWFEWVGFAYGFHWKAAVAQAISNKMVKIHTLRQLQNLNPMDLPPFHEDLFSLKCQIVHTNEQFHLWDFVC